ncbi:uncharacterized protein A4U43_C05F7390 [Asparagus officinalis]|uniref:Uncharacterized protein n=1 Tax=Asparagus officinalis TaxID=4686 RepID=A0A5P1EPZ9_ASPOF|nr:uncharacterized protein A4U43_C05F7390 [Asparagus officinalis]
MIHGHRPLVRPCGVFSSEGALGSLLGSTRFPADARHRYPLRHRVGTTPAQWSSRYHWCSSERYRYHVDAVVDSKRVKPGDDVGGVATAVPHTLYIAALAAAGASGSVPAALRRCWRLARLAGGGGKVWVPWPSPGRRSTGREAAALLSVAVCALVLCLRHKYARVEVPNACRLAFL